MRIPHRRGVISARSIICVPLVLWIVSAAVAQNETGTRTINRDRFRQLGYWYDSSTARFHARYPIIRSLPPVNSGMPLDMLAAYIAMDSLARFDREGRAEQTLDRWRAERRITDTLRQTAKYLYTLADYNPIIFTQYLDEISLKYRSKYWASLSAIASKAAAALLDALPDAERKAGMLALLESSYILRVTVLAVDSLPSGSDSPAAKYFYRVTATVIDTLKGRVFQSCSGPQLLAAQGERPPVPPSVPCIQFVYVPNLYLTPRYVPPEGMGLYTARDPAFTSGPDSLFAMKAGQEAVVFIRHTNSLVDSSYDYYHLRLDSRCSFGALPIIKGSVRDLNRIWSDEPMLSYPDWRRRFMELRDRLLAGRY